MFCACSIHQNYCVSTYAHFFIAVYIVAIASVAQPLDVIKTRIQSRSFDSPESGASVIRNLLRNEGPTALFKGVVPKLSVVGPKLVFSFSVAQHLIASLEKLFMA